MTRSSKAAARTAGFTFIENIVAIGIIAVGFVALYAISGQCMRLMYAAREETTSGQAMQDRLDSLRKCTWTQITDATYLSANIMNTAANNAPLMNKMTETLTVDAYPTAASPPIQLTRSSAGVVTTVTTNSAIANGDLVKITVQMAWTSWSGNHAHTETISTIYAQNTK